MENAKYTSSQLKIMRTAFLTAFPKIFTDIPYTTDIFKATLSLAVKNGFSFLPEQFTAEMSPEIEARYKAASSVLRDEISKASTKPDIIEIASGMSPRALEFPNADYYEIDFPLIMEQKRSIYQIIKANIPEDSLIGVDLSDIHRFSSTLKKITNDHPQKPLIFLSEGLFWYLSRDEIKSLSSIIYSTISAIGGCWITTDCPVSKTGQDSSSGSYRSIITKSSNREDKKPFHNRAEFDGFFRGMNYITEYHDLLEAISISNLSSKKLFSYSDPEIITRINNYTSISILRIDKK